MTVFTIEDLAVRLDTITNNMVNFTQQMRDWTAGTVTGGFNIDGSASDGVSPHGGFYPLSNGLATYYIACPAKMSHDTMKGDTGADGGLKYLFSGPTADADPTSGKVRLNNALPASATTLFFSNNEAGGGDMSVWLDALDDSTNPTLKSHLTLRQGSTALAMYNVNGAIVTAAGYRKVPVTYLGGFGAFIDGQSVVVSDAPFGNIGPAGAASTVAGPTAWQNPAPWVTATNYVSVAPTSIVTFGGETFSCLVAHTSGTFTTDLAANKWLKLAAKGTNGTGSGNVNPSGAIAAGSVAVFGDTTGNVIQSGPAIGVAAATSLLDRQSGDARYLKTGVDISIAGNKFLASGLTSSVTAGLGVGFLQFGSHATALNNAYLQSDGAGGIGFYRGVQGSGSFLGTMDPSGNFTATGTITSGANLVWHAGSLLRATAVQINAATNANLFIAPKELLDAQAFTTASVSGAYAPNFALGSNWIFTLTANMTLSIPTGMYDGQQGVLYFIQPAIGGKTLALAASIATPGHVTPTLSTTANAVDRCGYVVRTIGGVKTLELTLIELDIR